MNYFLEGVDGAGKSTLANVLHNQTGYEIIHRHKPESDEEKQEMFQSYFTNLHMKKHFIWDRCWYSEFVYGKVMRDSVTLSYEEMYDLEFKAAKNGGGIILYCRSSNISQMFNRMQRRGEDYVQTVGQLRDLQEAYDKLFFSMPHYLPVVTMDPLSQKLCPLY